jgi:hypothetical protein
MGTPAPAVYPNTTNLFTTISRVGPTNDGTSKSTPYCIATLTVTSATGREYSEEEMWSTYMEQVKEFDRRLTDSWKEDATGILVFVSCSLLITPSIAITAKRPVFSLRQSAHLSSNSTKGCPPIVAIRQQPFFARFQSNFPISRTAPAPHQLRTNELLPMRL